MRKSEQASGSTPVLSTNYGSKLNNQTVTLCHIGTCYLVGLSWHTWYMRHVRVKLKHTESKPNTRYVLWRFDILQRNSVWSASQGFVVRGDDKPQRSSEASVNRVNTFREQSRVRIMESNPTVTTGQSEISQDSNVTAIETLENILLHNSLNNFIKKLSSLTAWLRQASDSWDNSVSYL